MYVYLHALKIGTEVREFSNRDFLSLEVPFIQSYSITSASLRLNSGIMAVGKNKGLSKGGKKGVKKKM